MSSAVGELLQLQQHCLETLLLLLLLQLLHSPTADDSQCSRNVTDYAILTECLETSLPGNLATLNAIAQPYFVPSPELAISELKCSSRPDLATFSTYDLCASNIAMIDVRAVN